MSQPSSPKFTPPIDTSKVPPEIAMHLSLIFERLENHATAVRNLQNQINQLKGK
jgi:hypothetical protein